MVQIDYKTPLTIGTRGSAVVKHCQVCQSENLETIMFLGFLPPVNTMQPIGERPHEQSSYPAELIRCRRCQLVQLGLVVDPGILFPPDYAYTSGTTRILRENFAELATEAIPLLNLSKDELVVDIGSNDGTLLSNFAQGHRVIGIEPTNVGHKAIERGIPTYVMFFGRDAATKVVGEHGKAAVVTATNVFAHIENIHTIVESILQMLAPKGVFISESHYLLSLVETLQYDTIYHEHLRYYSLHSLKYLLEMHDLEVFHVKQIPTHGGSIRAYAAHKGTRPVQPSVGEQLKKEADSGLVEDRLFVFKRNVVMSKMGLHRLLLEVKKKGGRICGIGAPSRAVTMVNYVGLDDGIIDAVLEIKGSHKIGKYMPGTLIPVLEESILFEQQPEYALLFSWHIADELMPKLTQRGFKGDYIVPLPEARIVKGAALVP